jgi:hypothetical protein
MVSARILLPIVYEYVLNNKEAKASESTESFRGTRMSEDIISCYVIALLNIANSHHKKCS